MSEALLITAEAAARRATDAAMSELRGTIARAVELRDQVGETASPAAIQDLDDRIAVSRGLVDEGPGVGD